MKFRVAAVQSASVAFDAAASIEKLGRLSDDAAHHGARLAVFPEVFVSGYPRGLDFGVTIGDRSPSGREEFLRYAVGAIEVPGPHCDVIGKVARRTQLTLVVGVTERSGGTLYCTALIFAPDGSLLAKHRKLMPTALERVIWGCGDGSTMPVVKTELGRVGAAICWENYMPLYRTHLYQHGVEIYCAPTADGRDAWTSTMRHIALEGRCFVIGCNQFATRSDYPATYRTRFGDDPNTVLSRGGSCIVGPMGELLAGPVYDRAVTLYAELDTDDLTRAKFDFDVAGHYARPDVFDLRVNQRVADTQAGGSDE